MRSGSAETSSSPGQKRTWSLHDDGDGQGPYFYNEALGAFSTWARHLDLPPGLEPEDCNDTHLWLALAERQIREVYKMCSHCASSQENFSDPFYVCGTCLKHCHMNCSKQCTMVVDSQLWDTYGPYLRTCVVCLDEAAPAEGYVPDGPTHDQMSAQAALNRLKSISLPHSVRHKLQSIEDQVSERRMSESQGMSAVTHVVRDHYCPGGNTPLFQLRSIPGRGNGIFASKFIPALTRVGVYPGYPDPNSAEQCKRGRPSPIYALAEFNAADYYNVPFPELKDCVTPFLNEPGEGEFSNTAWLQETSDAVEHGRLSVVTVRDIHPDEEVTLSYGPLYPRNYPYAYDAYSFHPAEEDDGTAIPDTYILWYYASREAEADQKGWVKFDKRCDKFSWLK